MQNKHPIRLKTTFLVSLLILAASIIVGYLALVAIFALPLKEDAQCHERTVKTLYDEGLYPSDIYLWRNIDNWSDSYSLLIASYDGNENVFEKAAAAYHVQAGYNPYDWLSGRIDAVPQKMSYSRYWHGYLLFLRPLMTVASLNGIRRLNLVCLFASITLVCIMMQRKLKRCLLPFLLFLLLLSPVCLGKCFEYSRIVYVMLLMSFLLLWDPKPLRSSSSLLYLFLAGGILTAYLDFLTAPLLTLCVPLTILCIRDMYHKGILKTGILCCVFWGLGYAGMWFGKWVIAYLWQGEWFLHELFHSMQERSSFLELQGNLPERLYAVILNFKQLLNNYFLDAFLLFGALAALCFTFINRKRITKESIRISLFLLGIALFAPAWYCLLANHSIVHYFLHTYRTCATSVFALLCALDLGNMTEENPHAQKNNGKTHKKGQHAIGTDDTHAVP